MSEQLLETRFCGFTAREVLVMKSRIDELKAKAQHLEQTCLDQWENLNNAKDNLKVQLAIAVDALEEIKE